MSTPYELAKTGERHTARTQRDSGKANEASKSNGPTERRTVSGAGRRKQGSKVRSRRAP